MTRGDVQEREMKAYDSIDDFMVESSDEQWSDDCPSDEFSAKPKKKSKKKKKKRECDGGSDDDEGTDAVGKGRKKSKKAAAQKPKDTELGSWWSGLLTGEGEEVEDAALSGKMLVLLELLKEAAAAKEKLLLFSQSLLVLELIERILSRSGRWTLGRDYFRLDGSTNAKTRQGWVERFNDAHQHRARLFLISTKAGGLGVNLTAANRVVIFDAAWNPSVDTQAVFRAFRFGQEKSVFVYRLLAQGTMEEKIYWRQVSKNALASRVVDQEQATVQLSKENLSAPELFTFSDGGSAPQSTLSGQRPVDPVLCRLLDSLKPKWLAGYSDHDAMAEADEHERDLTQAQKDEAMLEYEEGSKKKQKPKLQLVPVPKESSGGAQGVPVNKDSLQDFIEPAKAANQTNKEIGNNHIPSEDCTAKQHVKPEGGTDRKDGKQASMLSFFSKAP